MNNKNKVRVILGIGIILLIVLFFVHFVSSKDDKEYFISLSYEELLEKLENKESFLLCVSSTTCSHCASFKPKLKEVAEDYEVEIYYTDINLYSEEDNENFRNTYKIDGTPTTLIFKDGKEESVMSRLEGDVSKSKVINVLDKYGFINK
jgi:predicted bacteriocin transport accessory protein